MSLTACAPTSPPQHRHHDPVCPPAVCQNGNRRDRTQPQNWQDRPQALGRTARFERELIRNHERHPEPDQESENPSPVPSREVEGLQVYPAFGGACRVGRPCRPGADGSPLPIRVRKRKRAAEVQDEEIQQERQEEGTRPAPDVRLLQGSESLPPEEDGHKKQKHRPGEGEPVPLHGVARADQFPNALGQVRQPEPNDDRDEGDEILKLAHDGLELSISSGSPLNGRPSGHARPAGGRRARLRECLSVRDSFDSNDTGCTCKP
ncbi:hypothetical protein GGP54_002869 [Salinibacter ruber]|uniref:Uncharacterized protein n=1 Tax=Salinibacter ruber TaxID=146919 RepID=A0A9X2UNB4_9BACT|nr:hypothetical protein [Salinibacter ruber]MCS4037682.1 hypothetical protein [Salinibacter ruber]